MVMYSHERVDTVGKTDGNPVYNPPKA